MSHQEPMQLAPCSNTQLITYWNGKHKGKHKVAPRNHPLWAIVKIRAIMGKLIFSDPPSHWKSRTSAKEAATILEAAAVSPAHSIARTVWKSRVHMVFAPCGVQKHTQGAFQIIVKKGTRTPIIPLRRIQVSDQA
jgi:hypothetical protein